MWKVRIWEFCEPFVYYPYFVRLLKNSPIISLLIYSDICFSLKKSLTWTSGFSTQWQTVCVIDKMAILSNTNVRCIICESGRQSIFIRIYLPLSSQAGACKSEGTPAGTKCRWPSGSADEICLLLLIYSYSLDFHVGGRTKPFEFHWWLFY